MTGRVVECPMDEMNRPRGRKDARLRIPPSRGGDGAAVRRLGRRAGRLPQVRADGPQLRRGAVDGRGRVAGQRGRILDLDDIKWDLGPFGKLHVRHGKGSRGSGPRERMVPLINNAGTDAALVHRGRVGPVRRRPHPAGCAAVPVRAHQRRRILPPRRLRRVAGRAWPRPRAAPARLGAQLTPHVLRHFCASQLYLCGVDLISIQEMLGHSWVATTMRYVHVHRTRIEEAWLAGQQRAAGRLEGLI